MIPTNARTLQGSAEKLACSCDARRGQCFAQHCGALSVQKGKRGDPAGLSARTSSIGCVKCVAGTRLGKPVGFICACAECVARTRFSALNQNGRLGVQDTLARHSGRGRPRPVRRWQGGQGLAGLHWRQKLQDQALQGLPRRSPPQQGL